MSEKPIQLQQFQALTLRDQIERQILDAILNGAFIPGERLVESSIADQLGVSRAPVREALSALVHAGIIVNVSRRGFYLVDFTDQDIEEIYSLRLILEVSALQRAMERLGEPEIAELQKMVDNIGEAARQRRDIRAAVAYDFAFHEIICRAANHGRLLATWRSMRLQTYLLIGVTNATFYDFPDQPRQLHQSILDAIMDQDIARSTAILTEHILDGQRRARRALADQQSSTNESKR